ncbi:hypothetical protein I5N09_11890 [Serratia marcescens]|nr:hypothetical protein [Serratia marcescens]MBH3218714.1 hypothetical protein [Serratia marcescens]
MIHYHGGPVTPDTCALKAWRARHAFISFVHDSQVGLAAEICQSFAIDEHLANRASAVCIVGAAGS